MPISLTTAAIAKNLNATLIGRGDIVITRLVHPDDARDAQDLVLAVDPTLHPLLAKGLARAAVISADKNIDPETLKPETLGVEACIIVNRSRLAMATLTNLFDEPVNLSPGVHPTALIEEGAKLGAHVTIGAYAVISRGAVIGDNSVIHPHCTIGPNAVIGHNALIHAGVRIGAHVIIGNRFIIHFNSSIGADGFSFVTPEPGSVEEAKKGGASSVSASNTSFVRIASIGTVIIGDDVEVGANSSIDRGTIAATRIGNGTKVDNQVQIGHNVVIGENCLVCGRSGIAGSVVIGDRVVVGGASGVADHVTIGDDAVIMGMSGVAGNVQPRSIVGGFPAMPRERVVENIYNVGRIRQLIKKINALTERFDEADKKKAERAS